MHSHAHTHTRTPVYIVIWQTRANRTLYLIALITDSSDIKSPLPTLMKTGFCVRRKRRDINDRPILRISIHIQHSETSQQYHFCSCLSIYTHIYLVFLSTDSSQLGILCYHSNYTFASENREIRNPKSSDLSPCLALKPACPKDLLCCWPLISQIPSVLWTF